VDEGPGWAGKTASMIYCRKTDCRGISDALCASVHRKQRRLSVMSQVANMSLPSEA